MLSLEQAQAAIRAAVRPCQRTLTVTLAGATGRTLAAPVRARTDHPAFDNSAMDGYAVRSADLPGKGYHLPLRGTARCGDAPGRLVPGTSQRVFTGAPLPAGADTVVIQEDIRREGEDVIFPASTSAGQNLRRCGEDFHSGDTLYQAGHRLRAWDIALLATAGVDRVEVYTPPRVLVLATGDELVAPGQPLAPGQVYESNRVTTLALLAGLDVEAVDGGTVRDDPEALRARLCDVSDYDFIVTSGGASVGDHDVVKQVFADIGRIEFWKVRVKPGKPIAFGHIGERAHFFALPGNPVSSLVTFKLFVEPALAAWRHYAPVSPMLRATATASFRRRPGRTEFLRAQLSIVDGQLHATPLRGQGSHMVGPLRDTNGFIRVEAESSGFDGGSAVLVLPLGLDIA